MSEEAAGSASEPVNFYDLLQVARDSDVSELKRSFRRLSLIHHPDRGGSTETFQALNNAYKVLSDPDQRSVYDLYGAEGVATFMSTRAWIPEAYMEDVIGIFPGLGLRGALLLPLAYPTSLLLSRYLWLRFDLLAALALGFWLSPAVLLTHIDTSASASALSFIARGGALGSCVWLLCAHALVWLVPFSAPTFDLLCALCFPLLLAIWPTLRHTHYDAVLIGTAVSFALSLPLLPSSASAFELSWTHSFAARLTLSSLLFPLAVALLYVSLAPLPRAAPSVLLFPVLRRLAVLCELLLVVVREWPVLAVPLLHLLDYALHFPLELFAVVLLGMFALYHVYARLYTFLSHVTILSILVVYTALPWLSVSIGWISVGFYAGGMRVQMHILVCIVQLVCIAQRMGKDGWHEMIQWGDALVMQGYGVVWYAEAQRGDMAEWFWMTMVAAPLLGLVWVQIVVEVLKTVKKDIEEELKKEKVEGVEGAAESPLAEPPQDATDTAPSSVHIS